VYLKTAHAAVYLFKPALIMALQFENTIFEPVLTVAEIKDSALTKEQGGNLFQFFKECPLFRWQDANNDCEDRANAICIALDAWNIPNYKAWVFSASFLKRGNGCLKNNWGYHVAALIAITEGGGLRFYVIDPATVATLEPIEVWANNATETATSYYCITTGDTYIFDPGNIRPDTWYRRNRQNYKWTIQGLAGINGVTRTGKAQLVFQKARIRKCEDKFQELLRHHPPLLSR
jgi:hypothetical protein